MSPKSRNPDGKLRGDHQVKFSRLLILAILTLDQMPRSADRVDSCSFY
jgi:hypothetical protein